MAVESSKNFNKRLSQWVASQGFWFQIRYSMSSGGMRGRAVFHLFRLCMRVLIFIALLTAGTWFYLLKRTESGGFSRTISNGIKQGIAGSELAIRGLRYTQGQLEISRLAAEGKDGTFFEAMEAVSLRCKMSLVESVIGTWETGVVSVASLDVDLRAGADDEESSAKLGEVLFGEAERVKINAIHVGKANLRWGFSKRAQGEIRGSALRAQRTLEGWRLSFKGGTFQQNWLKDLQIVSLVALCTPEGIQFEEAQLRQGDGTLSFDGLRVIAGSRPEIKGTVKLDRLKLGLLLPEAASDFLEGTISGEFKAFGSTNSSQGVGFEGMVIMDGEDMITLRDRLPLLTALSVMDYSRSYHRIDFREGSFHMRTHAGGLELTELDLLSTSNVEQKVDTFFTLKGEMKVRLPTQQEIQKAVAEGSAGDSPFLFGLGRSNEFEDVLKSGGNDFSLKRAAIEAERERKGIENPGEYTLFDRLTLNSELRELEVQASERMSRMLQYEGEFQISIPGDAFERAGELQQVYPMDSKTGRIPMVVPIKGLLNEITNKQAQEIYAKGRRL